VRTLLQGTGRVLGSARRCGSAQGPWAGPRGRLERYSRARHNGELLRRATASSTYAVGAGLLALQNCNWQGAGALRGAQVCCEAVCVKLKLIAT
jgi:hypothetical protein